MNLGRHFAVAQKDWPLLCQRLEQLLVGQEPLLPLPCPVGVEREAQRIAAQLLVREAELAPSESAASEAEGDVQSVDVNSLQRIQSG